MEFFSILVYCQFVTIFPSGHFRDCSKEKHEPKKQFPIDRNIKTNAFMTAGKDDCDLKQDS